MNKNTVRPGYRISDHPEYGLFSGMKQRCYYTKHQHYYRYGGRGIKMSDRWSKHGGFWNFIEDMGERPGPEYTVERIDNDGNYEPSNCRWATRKEQANNRSVRNDNSSGVTGVDFDRTHNYWKARRTLPDGSRINLGHFKNEADAIGAMYTFNECFGLI